MVHTVVLLGTVPLLPSLNSRPSGNELIISLPTNVAGFALQSVPCLIPPMTWIDSTKSPVVLGVQFTITAAASDGSQFY